MLSLVQTTTADGLVLSALYHKGDTSKPLIIHVHGFEGDFFTNKFIQAIEIELASKNIGFLSIQTRGTTSDCLFKKTDGTWKRGGSHFELHEEAYMDIDAWVEFAQHEGYSSVILQGHSLGTMKVIRYLSEGTFPDKVTKLILLAPFDNIVMAENFASKKWRANLAIAKQKVAEGKGEDIMPKEFWDVEMSYQTYVSWLDDNDYTHMFDFYDKKYDFPILNKIEIPVKVLVGTKDEFFHGSNPTNPREAIEILEKNIKNVSANLIEGSNHGFMGYEPLVAKEVSEFAA